MKQIITVPYRNKITTDELETKMRNAKQSNDYIQIKFGNNGKWIKVAFCKDQTYVIGYNFIDVSFATKLSYLVKQYPITVINKLSNWLVDWVNKLNR